VIKNSFFCFFSILFTFSADAKIKEKSESETYTEQELLEKDQEVRVAAFKTGCQVAGTAAAVALTPPPANVLVGAAGACAIHDSYTVGKEAENDLAAMHAHNARATTAKDRNHESSRDQRAFDRLQRSKTSRSTRNSVSKRTQ
jgi:hypothetical protein